QAGNSAGLSDLLSNGAITTQKLASCLEETFLPGLRLLSRGSEMPGYEFSRLLASAAQGLLTALRQWLATNEGKPGLIVFHCPPVLAGIDASEIGALVDQTFLLIVSGRTTRVQARKAREQLDRAHAKLAGIIMLDV